MRSSKSRSRSKNNRNRTLGNVVNRVFDSSGPEGKVRGTPQQIIDKYLALARDAQLSNDRVAEQSFLQHAEHYTRMLGEAQREQAERQQQFQPQQRQQNDEDRDQRDRDVADHVEPAPEIAAQDDQPAPVIEPVSQPEILQPAPQDQHPEAAEALPDAVEVEADAGPVATPETKPARARRTGTPRPRGQGRSRAAAPAVEGEAPREAAGE